MHPTIIRIDQQQLRTNLHLIRTHLAPAVKICLPVKANAYGHGIKLIAPLAEPLVDMLAVACLDEGRLLRELGITKPILVMGAIDCAQIPGLVATGLEFTISSMYKAQAVIAYCHQHQLTAKVHLKIDTGMNRIGVRVTSAYELIDLVYQAPELELAGVYSHFAASDEVDNPLNALQLAQFSEIVAYVKRLDPTICCHLANSAAVCNLPDSHFDMVRPGIMSYGYLPTPVAATSQLAAIKPCFSLISKVAYFKVVAADQGISYNHCYRTQTTTRVVTLPIGYGDGYRRGLSNCGQVIIRGHKYTISGAICMDMLMVDIGTQGEAYVGDEAVLIGRQGSEEITLSEVAGQLNTIIYEVLVGFNERIVRELI
jgi:alanine racemase